MLLTDEDCVCIPQGSATVGLKSKTHVVLVALKVSGCYGNSQ